MGTSELAIIIPAYNEENTIASVINKVSSFGDVIVINDCSTDDTQHKAEAAGAILVNHAKNQGYDGALNSGFSYADQHNYRYAITFDADGQHSAKLIAQYLAQLKEYQLVLGVRPSKARFAEKIFALYTNLAYGVKDPLCGMKGYHMTLYKKLGHFDAIQSIGTELALYSIKHHCRYVQLPIPIAEREDQPRFGRLLKANITIIKAMFNYIKKHH